MDLHINLLDVDLTAVGDLRGSTSDPESGVDTRVLITGVGINCHNHALGNTIYIPRYWESNGTR